MNNLDLKTVHQFLNDENFSEAFAAISSLIETNNVSRNSEVTELYQLILTKHCEKLERDGRFTEMFECYGKALDVCPGQKSHICNELAATLLR